MMRFLATFVLPLLWQHISPIFFIIFVAIILLTDFFDGFLARRFHVQSLFGSILDTIADKFFGIIIILMVAKYLKMFYLLMALEIAIALINTIAALLGAKTRSSTIGRLKMWFLGVAICLGILVIFASDMSALLKDTALWPLFVTIMDFKENILLGLIFLTMGAQLMVFFDYLARFIREFRQHKVQKNFKVKAQPDLKYVLFNTDYYLQNKNNSLAVHLFKN